MAMKSNCNGFEVVHNKTILLDELMDSTSEDPWQAALKCPNSGLECASIPIALCDEMDECFVSFTFKSVSFHKEKNFRQSLENVGKSLEN